MHHPEHSVVSAPRLPTRADARRALGIKLYTVPLVLAFAPVFALLAVVLPSERVRWVWGWFALGAALVGGVMGIENRRSVRCAPWPFGRAGERADARPPPRSSPPSTAPRAPTPPLPGTTRLVLTACAVLLLIVAACALVIHLSD